jgi:hypothetical protein
VALAAALACVPPAGVRANDTIGHLAAGGIVWAHSDDIEMRAEDLYISTEEIRVQYRFFNHADHEVTELVAFPLPDTEAIWLEYNNNIPVQDPGNFLGFETKVDGQPVAMQLEQRALALGIDRTDLLLRLDVPLAPFLESTAKALKALPEDTIRELVRLGLANNPEMGVYPSWILRTTYYWEQTFPAGKELIVEHRYRPSVGSTTGLVVGDVDMPDPEKMADYRRRYCMDDRFIAAIRKLRARGRYLTEQRLEYVLVTGANWAGPIGDFRLVVDKGSPDNLASFCGKGAKKIAPTRFEIREADYWPNRNLEVLIVVPRTD